MDVVNRQLFPFGDGQPLRDGAPYLGGVLVQIPAGAANANATHAHGLRRLPRFFMVFDVGTNAAIATPFPRGTSAWTVAQFSLNLPALSAPVWGLLA